jgi:tetratricopeptide (TPR) repeat protein
MGYMGEKDKEKKEQLFKYAEILSNIAMCYLKLNLYEDCTDYCDLALKVDINHKKTLFRIAKAASFLFKFTVSTGVFKGL